jgi:formate hydrogenlyase subunit 6/NADH:ubiquinone oxidoreductase subunit I
MPYFTDIQAGIRTTLKGLSLTWRHLRAATRQRKPMGVASDNYFDLQDGLVTLQYPHEQLPIPDNGRYRLHNEIDDCIVCDKCAKICPVDCITIEPIKATGEIGRASDGSPIRLYAATFDIDMAKCCYCGLCTVVCPTECLTMEKKFDYSSFELGDLTYAFANLTTEQADEKRALYDQFIQEKDAEKARKAAAIQPVVMPASEPAAQPAKRPAFRPTAKPAAPKAEATTDAVPPTSVMVDPVSEPGVAPASSVLPADAPKRPAFRPTLKPKPAEPTSVADATPDEAEKIAMVGLPDSVTESKVTEPMTEAEKQTDAPDVPAIAAPADAPKPKPAFRPTMKPKNPDA